MKWKAIPNYEGYYEVSSCGLIKSVERRVPNHKGSRRVPEKILKPNTDKDGYLYISLTRYGSAKTFKVHRIVATTFFGESNLVINHKNMNKKDNRISNLEYVTVAENNHHARENKEFNVSKGENHYAFRITKEIKDEIIKLKMAGISNEEISSKFKIHPATVYKFYKPKKKIN